MTAKLRNPNLYKTRKIDYEGSSLYSFEELKALDTTIKVKVIRDIPEIDLPHITIGPYEVSDDQCELPLWIAEYLYKHNFIDITMDNICPHEQLKVKIDNIKRQKFTEEITRNVPPLDLDPVEYDDMFFVYRRVAAMVGDKAFLALVNEYQSKRKHNIDVMTDSICNAMKEFAVPEMNDLKNATTDEVIYLWSNLKTILQQYTYIYCTLSMPDKVKNSKSLVISNAEILSQTSHSQITSFSEMSETLQTANTSDFLQETSAGGIFTIDE